MTLNDWALSRAISTTVTCSPRLILGQVDSWQKVPDNPTEVSSMATVFPQIDFLFGHNTRVMCEQLTNSGSFVIIAREAFFKVWSPLQNCFMACKDHLRNFLSTCMESAVSASESVKWYWLSCNLRHSQWFWILMMVIVMIVMIMLYEVNCQTTVLGVTR